MSKKQNKIAVLIVAGGNGSRMKHDIPKQYMPIHGKSILRHTIDIFDGIDDISIIQCVIGRGDENNYTQAVNGLDIMPFVYGGATRQESVYEGLRALEVCNPDIVLIHDAARPCVTSQDIHNLIHSLQNNDAVTLAMPVNETLHRDGTPISREKMMILQTPQAFTMDLISTCHDRAMKDNFIATDDTAIVMNYGHKVEYVTCGRHNLKITTKDDLKMANYLLSSDMEVRVGNGFDVHAFNDTPSTSIRLCGIDIPHDRSLKGHSDADVGLHALTDAIFGALADGDIGSHFSPSDQSFKNMDSHVFLDKSVDNLKSQGGKIKHIDITFMCEKPKIGLHREEIRQHLSNHLKLSTSRISVKATTTEKLGFTGREEGIACQVIVTIEVPKSDD